MSGIDWEDFDIYDSETLPDDWQHVTTIDDGGGYEWATLHAFWSPADRRYYWWGGSGCSCNYWGESLYTPSDFLWGDKAGLLRGIRAFADECFVDAARSIDAVRKVHMFREDQ